MILTKNIDTIIWDLDGTILDSFGVVVDVWNQVLPKHGFSTHTPDDVMYHYHGTLEETVVGLTGGTATDEQIAAMLKDFMVIDNDYIQDVDHHLFIDAVALSLHAHKAGLRQILVTNRAHGIERGNASPRTLIQNSRLRDCITTIFCGDETGYHKPDPRTLGELAQSIDPARTVTIGDQYKDAEFARELGANSILVDRGSGIVHLDRLGDGWEQHVTIVHSLSDVTLEGN